MLLLVPPAMCHGRCLLKIVITITHLEVEMEIELKLALFLASVVKYVKSSIICKTNNILCQIPYIIDMNLICLIMLELHAVILILP